MWYNTLTTKTRGPIALKRVFIIIIITKCKVTQKLYVYMIDNLN